MSTYHLGLYYRELPEDDVPGRPISHVYVKAPLSYPYPDAGNLLFLTPREFGPSVVESQIDALIEELKEIRKEVRRRYAEYDRKLAIRRQSQGPTSS